MIRKMQKHEVDCVVSIWLETSVHSHGFIPSDYWHAKKSDIRDIYIPNSETWLFEHQGQLIGFYSLVGDVLAALFVLPSFHGRGTGSELLNHAVSQRNCLELTVYKENLRSYKFYEKRGFSVVREQRDAETGSLEYLMKFGAE